MKLFFLWSYSIALVLLISTLVLLDFEWATKISLFYPMNLFGLLLAEITFKNRSRLFNSGKKTTGKQWFILGLIFNYTIPALVFYLSKQPANSTFGQIVIFSVLAINGLVICFYIYKISRIGYTGVTGK